MKQFYSPFLRNLIFSIIVFYSIQYFKAQTNFAQYVNPMIGTGGHGHTFPGATVPFGMVQLSPDTRIDGSWDGCSGYHHDDVLLYGFSHTHLSGTGCSDFGDILLLPIITKVQASDLAQRKFSATFKHENEEASAGYYAVEMDNGIKAELTATTRVGFHQYTFPKSEYAYILLDLELRDKVINAEANLKANTKVTGYRASEAWAKNQIVMYDLEFSEPFVEAFSVDGPLTSEASVKGKKVRICFKFKLPESLVIKAKVALSPTTIEGAEKNMMAECRHWDFNKVKMQAEGSWNKALSKIEVKSNDIVQLNTFYTALYHCMIQPNVAMDVDGMYRGRDNKIHKAEGFTYYSVFSLWDTYRGEHPLFTIIDQQRTSDFINTFIAQYEQGGRLPVWELASNETDCMIGYHAVSVIADAMVKGIKGFDYEKAFVASKHSAMLDHFGLKYYKANGYISSEFEGESVSKTLEYAYDDWCIAQMAKLLKKPNDYWYFMKRSQSWKNLFDPITGFMRAKKNGNWILPFEPREVNMHYTEGNAWQYSFYVPQDIPGLISKMGGAEKFGQQLDLLFTTSSETTGRDQADISGLIGQYAHGNEPSHHMAYLYNYIQAPQKTAKYVNTILNTLYSPSPDGLSGNEDCGQMSAWYVLSAIGFYAVSPGSSDYNIGSPLFDEVRINLENGKQFTLLAKNRNAENIYVANMNLNGKAHLSYTLNHNSVMNGDAIVFEMQGLSMLKRSNEPIKTVSSIIKPSEILSVPLIVSPKNSFNDSLVISMQSEAKIYYSICSKGQTPKIFMPYKKPICIYTDKIIYAFAKDKLLSSDTVQAYFFQRPNNWQINLASRYAPQYSASGDDALIDGIRGNEHWHNGNWQGYQGKDVEAIIDLGQEQNLSTISVGFLQDARSWILFPTEVSYYTSSDNMNFVFHSKVIQQVNALDNVTQLRNIMSDNKALKTRYIKVVAKHFGLLPEGHEGKGGQSWLFLDEVEVK